MNTLPEQILARDFASETYTRENSHLLELMDHLPRLIRHIKETSHGDPTDEQVFDCVIVVGALATGVPVPDEMQGTMAKDWQVQIYDLIDLLVTTKAGCTKEKDEAKWSESAFEVVPKTMKFLDGFYKQKAYDFYNRWLKRYRQNLRNISGDTKHL